MFFFSRIISPQKAVFLYGALLLALSGCRGQETQNSGAAQPGVAGLDLQNEDYREARSHFQTQLVKQAPAPQEGEALQAPTGAVQVTYSPKLGLKAWVNAPVAGATTVKRPAVVFLHGGFAMSAEDWQMSQPYRDAGFIVMMPALRGENGQSGSYSMFYNEVSDVLEATSYLAKMPTVDAGHIYVAGHSVGGTLAQLCALTSSRFQAGASFSGAPDPIAWSKGQPEVVPFDSKQLKEFQMRSSLAYATSFKCPMRLYYGTEEKWCARSSQLVAERAKGAGLNVEALAVPGDHFSEVPAAMQQSIVFFKSHP